MSCWWAADAVVFTLNLPRSDWTRQTQPNQRFLNVGCGEDLSIAELARQIADTVGFAGSLVFDRNKPDGTPRKLLDVSRLSALGWRARRPLAKGLRDSYTWFLGHQNSARL